MSERSISPGLLVAMPQLQDPNFYRSVVLMVQHDQTSTLGLVVNRPSEMSVSDILLPMGIHWAGPLGEVVWGGGPVMPQSGWLLHSPVDEIPEEDGMLVLVPGISLSTTPGNLRLLAEHPPPHARFLMGYAGWGAGQLEMELAAGAWLALEATPELVFETEPKSMWEATLQSIGVDPDSLFPGVGVH